MQLLMTAGKLLLAIILLSLFSFYLAIRPFRIVSTMTPLDLGLQYEKVTFETADKITLQAWYVPAKIATKKTIILLHGYPADKGNILPVMHFLHSYYNLFLFDFRYFGESGGAYTTVGKDEVNDLLAAVQYLKNRNIHDIGVFGFSMGGAVAIMTASRTSDIKAVVADSSYARLDWMVEDHYRLPILKEVMAPLVRLWGWLFLGHDLKTVNPADALTKLHIPVLLIHSTDDNVIPQRHALLLQEKTAGNPRFKIISKQQLRHGEVGADYDKLILDFFRNALP